jgi:hypothetical protein
MNGALRAPWRRAIAIACAACASALAQPAPPSDEAALQLADRTAGPVESARDLRAFLEGAVGRQEPAGIGPSQWIRRASVDLHYEHEAAPGWRVVFADRVDVATPAAVPGAGRAIHTLKEAYATWQGGSAMILDAGRINVHEGVASGYNPTDWLREGAVRSLVSLDPASLRENRQGSAMLRGQAVWDSGSAALLWSPRLGESPHAAGWNPDVGATNGADRWMLTASQKLVDDWAPQFLLFKETALPLQAGVNATALLGDATVAYLEWSGGRSATLLSRALAGAGLPDAPGENPAAAFRNRTAAGVTYTTAGKLSLTAEFDFDGAAMDGPAWERLAQSPAAYGAYRLSLLTLREPPTRRAAFLWARWQDAIIDRLDLSAMVNLDTIDRSRRSWCETRYRLERTELALQWQRFDGTRASDYGASPQRNAWVVLLRWYP